jgi:hypothetical protein
METKENDLLDRFRGVHEDIELIHDYQDVDAWVEDYLVWFDATIFKSVGDSQSSDYTCYVDSIEITSVHEEDGSYIALKPSEIEMLEQSLINNIQNVLND